MTAAAEEVDLYHDTCHHRIYFMTCEELDALRAFAGYACQICGLPEREAKRGRLCIDHLGDYGHPLVRGLLCDKCNAYMRRVDDCTIRNPRSEVYRYRNNAWCLRMLMLGKGWTIDRGGRWRRDRRRSLVK